MYANVLSALGEPTGLSALLSMLMIVLISAAKVAAILGLGWLLYTLLRREPRELDYPSRSNDHNGLPPPSV